jgi:hypothetical protein
VAKTVPWEHRAPELRNRVRDSATETWTRKDIMDLFEVRSTAAKKILRAVGQVHRLGTSYFVERQDLLALLEKTTKRQSVTAEFRRNLLAFQPPRRRPIPFTLDDQHRVTRAEDLPANIQLETGRLEIRGADRDDILRSLKLLISALENDYEGVSSYWDPVEDNRSEETGEMDSLLLTLAKLRMQKTLGCKDPTPQHQLKSALDAD